MQGNGTICSLLVYEIQETAEYNNIEDVVKDDTVKVSC